MAPAWPPSSIPNDFGVFSLSLGSSAHHSLRTRLQAASKAGYKVIDLFDACWAAHLHSELGLPSSSSIDIWAPTPENLRVAAQLGRLVESLGLRIACTQPCRDVDGLKDPVERRKALDGVAKRFPFMRAFGSDLVFLCANTREDGGVTANLRAVASDLAELGDMARDFSLRDGGPMIRVGYEGLSWARRNTWASTWEAVRLANRPNVGLILDAFNVLAVEFADPYAANGHGRIFSSEQEALDVVCASMSSLVASVPAEKIFFFQVADAQLVEPRKLKEAYAEYPDSTPALLPWSRGHRLFPCEKDRGAYLPVHLVAAAVVATGYQGPISLEVFNNSLHHPDSNVPEEHARRGIEGLRALSKVIPKVVPFWEMWQQGCRGFGQTPSIQQGRL